MLGWHLDEEARTHIDEVIRTCVRDPVGPEFMAPPERAPEEELEEPAAPVD
jgi:hypothetical protein